MTSLNTAGRIVALLASAVAFEAAFAAPPEQSTALSEEVSKQNAIYESKGKETPEGYVVDRSLLSYASALPADFKESLAHLHGADRWLDIGAGEGRAVLDYATARYDAAAPALTLPAGRAHAVAMSIEDRRTGQWYQAAATLDSGRIRYVFGKKLGDYASGELGRFQLITDMIGGFSYSQDLTRFMEKTLALLDVNGSFYTVLQDVHNEMGTNKPHYAGSPFLTEIRDARGNEVRICQWLKHISCVEVTCQARGDWVPPIEVYRVKKTCEAVSVPRLAPVHYEAGTPPERAYVLTDVAPAATPAPVEQASAARQ
jgi:hypothetical protein